MSIHVSPFGCAAAVVVVLSFALCSSGADPVSSPAPTPTPRPGTLAAYAQQVTLDRSHTSAPGEPLLVTTQDLAEIGAGGALSVGNAPSAIADPGPIPTPDPAVRERWRRRYAAKSAVVHRLEARRAALQDDIRRLEGGRLTARSLARIDQTRSELASLEKELRSAREGLAVVVRAARKEGAEPGWFRGL